jgi:hypothetical protein|tara:strand:+ start:703 stop:1755 length:1053 start_codon:yes stop_codon:yes gene_type:complete
MRQKIRKAVAALSRGQLLRVDQTVAFDVNEPPYLPDALGACCTTGGAQDGTFCQCSDNVLGRDCCLQGGIHFPEAVCADLTCCEPGPDCFGAFCNNAPGTPAQCVEGTRSSPPEGDFIFQGCGSNCTTTSCPEPETINRCCKKCGDGYVDPNALNGECEAFQGMSEVYCNNENGVFTENATCEDSDVCEDACVEIVLGSCCHIDPDDGELVCGDQFTEGDCDKLDGVFKPGVECDSQPCAEVLILCCDAPSTVEMRTIFDTLFCIITSDCTKKLAELDDLPISCCSEAFDPNGLPNNDCSCLSLGCTTAKLLQLSDPDCNEHDCGGTQEFDCCPPETQATVFCGEEPPGL